MHENRHCSHRNGRCCWWRHLPTSDNTQSSSSENNTDTNFEANWGSFHYWESELNFGNLMNFWKLANQKGGYDVGLMGMGEYGEWGGVGDQGRSGEGDN